MQRKVQNKEISIVTCPLTKGVTVYYLASNDTLVLDDSGTFFKLVLGTKAGHLRVVDGVSLFVFLLIFPVCFILGFITPKSYSVWFIRLVNCKK